MNEQQIKNLIKVWYGKSKGERDNFVKFFLLWICFNAWLEYRSGEDTDKKMIDWLVNQSRTSSDLVESYERRKNTADFKSYLKFLVDNSPFKDSRGKGSGITVKDEDDFENIVKAIYRIRCNLFHGGSAAHKNEVQQQIAICTYILNEWIATLVVEVGAS
jgi:hypothetical protein